MYLSSADQAVLYNTFRPTPPQELINRIIDFLKHKSTLSLETAVDIGCGSGQSTYVLAPFFKSVVGIDNCPEQINEAIKKSDKNNVTFRIGGADVLDFPDSSVQLVTAGQCAHFFDMPKFYREVERILQKDGLLVIYGYCLPVPFYGDISLENIVNNMFLNKIRPYVSDESILVYIKNYKTKEFEHFPFSDKPVIREEFCKVLPNSSVRDLLGYVESWSGFQRLKKNCGESKASEIMNEFQIEIMREINKEKENPEDVKLSITFKYFALFGQKVRSL